MKAFKHYFFVLIIFTGCNAGEKSFTGQEVIDQAITTAGGELFQKATIDFDFRGRHYRSIRDYGKFQYERIFEDSTGRVRDVLNNEGFERYINDTVSTLTPDSMKTKYANSVNSVLYFALLPYGLNDPAVIKEYVGTGVIDNQTYHKVRVTFEQEGGGKDYQDVFMYWVNSTDFKVDYFGYTYVTDGGGARFRKAYNARVVNGIRFVDYINYKPTLAKMELSEFDEAFNRGELKELSRIELENINVEITE